jgi:hypothetical protein
MRVPLANLLVTEKNTSLFKGGYLPKPGVADAEEDTISTRMRCTCQKHIFQISSSTRQAWIFRLQLWTTDTKDVYCTLLYSVGMPYILSIAFIQMVVVCWHLLTRLAMCSSSCNIVYWKQTETHQCTYYLLFQESRMENNTSSTQILAGSLAKSSAFRISALRPFSGERR